MSHRYTPPSADSINLPRLRTIAGSSVEADGSLVDRLAGARLPSIELGGGWESPLNIGEFAREHPVVIYLYPGCSSDVGDREDTPQADATQHRAFRDHAPDFEAHQYRVLGISSQTKQAQRQTALANRVAHMLLCDPDLKLAAEFRLPTFPRNDGSWYQRVTLVVCGGHIVKTFFPVSNAARNAAQVIAWLTMHGDERGLGEAG
jgi:peroxiredoxin